MINVTMPPYAAKFKDLMQEASHMMTLNDLRELSAYVACLALNTSFQAAKSVAMKAAVMDRTMYAKMMTHYQTHIEQSLTIAVASIVKELYVKIEFKDPLLDAPKSGSKPKLTLVKKPVDEPPPVV